MRRTPLLSGLLLGTLLASLPVAASAQDPTLEGIDWRLVQIAGSGVPFIDVPEGVTATLRIDGTRAGGAGGCNSWFGDAKVDGDALIIGSVGSTMMACEEPAMSFEGQYLGYLDDIATWAIDGGQLRLADANGAVLLVFDAPGSTSIALEGTDWRVETLTVDGTALSIPAGIDVTMLLDAGQVAGVAACNRYFGDYTIDGSGLVFGPLGATEMACEEPRMEIEAAWLKALAQVVAYRLDGDRLALIDAADAEVASLRPAAAASVVGTWQLAELPTSDGAIVLVATDAFIELGADGSLVGDTGCNRLMGDHAVDGEAIKVGPVATTKMACKDPAASEIEAALLGALESAAGWRITVEGWLELVDASGALLAGFTPGTVSAA